MYAENSIVMRGDWQRIWELSSQIERWPEHLPHYRRVTINRSAKDNLEREAYMSAWRDILPVSWLSMQYLQPNADASRARVFYKHIGGVTKGMEVVWAFEPLGDDSYRVIITHEWQPKWPLVGGIASHLIGELIIKNIADKTLARVKQLANSRKLANAS